jgi:hypothetical protein
VIVTSFNGFGQEAQPDVTTLGYPSYVGINIGPDGQPYYKVMDDYAAAVAGMLNRYNVSAASPHVTAPDYEKFTVFLAVPPNDAAAYVAQQRGGRGIVLVGDVLPEREVWGGSGDGFVDVVLTNSLADTPEGGYVLADPDAGWQVGKPIDSWLGTQIKRPGLGLQWGALIGGGVAITIIGLHAMRSRKRGG